MSARANFRGSMPALVTPFKDGAVDEDAYRKLIDWVVESGQHGLVPVGTTGESPTLSHDEHRKVVEICIAEARGRVPVIAGAGSNNTREAVELAKHAEKAGADGVLIVTPYYNKPNQEGLFQHFKAIDAAIGIPIVIYNIPPRSVIDMVPETMGQLAKLDNIVGVKDATGDLMRVAKTRIACGTDFVQLSGEDGTTVGFNAMGGQGVISVTANVAPRQSAEVQAACLAGDYDRALELSDRLMPLHIAIFREPGVVGVKYAMSRLGLCEPDVRSPLTEATDETKAEIDAAMRHAGLLN
ncbi:MAG: 4-hydroxy-tetrahydrodipicolinate synthase [Hyphomicrobiales bacterium]|nr:4-hydroxy-tetrahydrodipicolinate synthase [Hyphomicrobiales bacterium]